MTETVSERERSDIPSRLRPVADETAVDDDSPPSQGARNAVVVLGSHRSGSSAVTGALHAAGLHLGPVIFARGDNEQGFFESQSILNLNRRILYRMGRDWTCPPARLDPGSYHADELLEALQPAISPGAPWGFKDPRTLFTLGAWASVLDGITPIGVYRSTADISESLRRRNGFAPEVADWIARAYSARLAHLHQALRFPIVHFGADHDRFLEQLKSAVTGLGLRWAPEVEAQFRADLIHHRHSSPDNTIDEYLISASSQPVAVRTLEPIVVGDALASVEPAPEPLSIMYVGPAHNARRLRSWRRSVTLVPDVGRVLEIAPGPIGGRGSLPGSPGLDVAEWSTVEVEAGAGFTHVIGADLLDHIDDEGVMSWLDALERCTDSNAVFAMSGMVVDTPHLMTHLYVAQEDRTYHRDQTPYLHHRDLFEASLLTRGWHIAGIEPVPEGAKSVVYLSRDPHLRRDGHLSFAEARSEIQRLDEDLDTTRRSLQDMSIRQARTERDLQTASRERDDLNRRVTEGQRNLDEARQRWKDTESALRAALDRRDARIAELGEASEDLKTKIATLGTRAKAAERSLHTSQAQYQRLVSRRSVRFLLRLARLARPLVRVVRGPRATGTVEARPAEPQVEALEGTDRGQTPVVVDDPEHPLERTSSDATPASTLAARVVPTEPTRITVIVPIHNAFDQVVRCLDAVVRNTSYRSQLLLIDDASTDARIWTHLEGFAQRYEGVRIVRNDENLGFVATVNRGMSMTADDVVILNSDTEVSPGWLRRISAVAHRHPTAATVTPLSNNAGAFSVPELGESAVLPAWLTLDEIGRLFSHTSLRLFPETPTGHGFCMYIRRTAIDQVGQFDEAAFPRGYGEENDFCMRAIAAGWTHVVDDSTIIFHERSASFGDARNELMASARSVIDERYPDYGDRVRSFVGSQPMKTIRELAGRVFESGDRTAARPRLLFVINRAGGGTPATNLDLMRELSSSFEPLLLESDSHRLILSTVDDTGSREVESWELDSQILPTDELRQDYRRIVDDVLIRWDIELVHIRHLLGHTFDLPAVAKANGVPVVLSLHDYYFACPTVHLLDENDQFCGGVCTPGQGSCRIPTPWLKDNLPHLKHAYVFDWRQRFLRMLRSVDVLVTASEAAQQVYIRAYPELKEFDFHVISHGRDLTQRTHVIDPDRQPELPVSIAVPGNLDVHKGADYLAEMKELDGDGQIELHLIGRVPDAYQHLGVVHPPYERDRLPEILAEIKPDFVGVFSQTAETFSHILAESWSVGIPVVATDRGAPAERVRRSGGGLLVDPEDAASAYEAILAASSDAARYREMVMTADLTGERTVAEMALDYRHVYHEVLNRASALGRDEAPLRVGLVVPGEGGRFPGSTHVRVLRRFFHPSISDRLLPVVVDAARFVDNPDLVNVDVMLVQRTGVSPELTKRFLSALRDRDIPLAFEIDDHLLGLHDGHPSYGDYQQWLDRLPLLLDAASCVTTSTSLLAEELHEPGRNIVVVPNLLDERLWFAPLGDVDPVETIKDGVCRVLYFGTATHVADLEMVHEVFDRLGDSFELSVVGLPSSDAIWYRTIPVPSGQASYPLFTQWLRGIAAGFRMGIVPLLDDEFNNMKSDLKYLEMSALGLPIVVSDRAPFKESVRHGENALLVDDDPTSWVNAIRSLAADDDLAQRIAANAEDYVRQSRTMNSGADQLVEILRRAAGRC